MRCCGECAGRLYCGPSPYQIDEFVCRNCQRSPAIQVRVLLAWARGQGFDFFTSWRVVLGDMITRSNGEPDFINGRVRWPHDTTHRREWKRIFADVDQQDVWRAAFEGEPRTEREKTLVNLALVA